MNKKFTVKAFVMLLIIFSLVINAALPVYGLFDRLALTVNNPIFKTGLWATAVNDEELQNEFEDSFVESFVGEGGDINDLYDDPTFEDIMELASTDRRGPTVDDYTINNIRIGDYLWEFKGIFQEAQANHVAIGFIRVIDRTLINGTPLHDYVLPPLPPGTFPEYSFFTAYDIRNSNTNNDYSIRFDNIAQITSEEPIRDLESISFYALRGLRRDTNELLEANRTFTVSISTDPNGPFTTIGSNTLTTHQANASYTGTDVSASFPEYTFNLTQTQIDNMPEDGYYVRIFFDGSMQGNGRNQARSRMIIDELTINTTNND